MNENQFLPAALVTLAAASRTRPGARVARLHAWRKRRRSRRAARLAADPSPADVDAALDELAQRWDVDL